MLILFQWASSQPTADLSLWNFVSRFLVISLCVSVPPPVSSPSPFPLFSFLPTSLLPLHCLECFSGESPPSLAPGSSLYSSFLQLPGVSAPHILVTCAALATSAGVPTGATTNPNHRKMILGTPPWVTHKVCIESYRASCPEPLLQPGLRH